VNRLRDRDATQRNNLSKALARGDGQVMSLSTVMHDDAGRKEAALTPALRRPVGDPGRVTTVHQVATS